MSMPPTAPLNPELVVLDRDRQHRMMMQMGSQRLLDSLVVHHPRIVRVLREKQGIDEKGHRASNTPAQQG